ncbi:uncharacterized protein GLRG_08507 [Colletotrichum graminicola M1.001]|uniref:Uncharacterized protein n=1 Tax=Colletotrichum graminicola (strain M1.001 / M2 / FGSC 10212) TaxID=645133 RepID=E3QRU0_COLGM|nr:uncharacterized protein GLRG_08507 [Colletotrichum graminicola M1.001]EFQ33578.1 hypothetical protein GLRG_08507 [Colletotrichum graminicola M1.001]
MCGGCSTINPQRRAPVDRVLSVAWTLKSLYAPFRCLWWPSRKGNGMWIRAPWYVIQESSAKKREPGGVAGDPDKAVDLGEVLYAVGGGGSGGGGHFFFSCYRTVYLVLVARTGEVFVIIVLAWDLCFTVSS